MRELTKEELQTIRIHMSAYMEMLWNQNRYKEAEDYRKILYKLDLMICEDKDDYLKIVDKLEEEE